MHHDMENELHLLKLENYYYKDKVKDLEKWLVIMLNNFYSGNPTQLTNLEQVIVFNIYNFIL
jgi:hypothetical protein